MHTSRCAKSRSRRCRCSCGGSFHGDAAPPVRPSPTPEPTNTTTVLAESLLSQGNIEVGISKSVVDAVERAVQDAVADSPPGVRSSLQHGAAGHFTCDLLAGAVEALAPLAEVDQTIAESVVDAALPGRVGLADEVAAKLLQKVIARTIGAIGATLLADAKAVVTLLRVSAVVTCPAVPDHKEVRVHCLAPLMGEQAGAAARAALERLGLATTSS